MKIMHPLLLSSFLPIFLASLVVPCEAEGGSIRLPTPAHDGRMSVEKALQERRSLRQYRNLPLSLAELSQLLWAAQGITGAGGKRTAPSAGALYPLEVCVVAGNVTGLSAGIYGYDARRHELNLIAAGDRRVDLAGAALGQSAIRSAPAVLVFSADYERTTGKYRDRGMRYVHMEAGHAAQNVSLQALSLDLGTVVIGAFSDAEVQQVLHLPEKQQPLSIMPVGRK